MKTAEEILIKHVGNNIYQHEVLLIVRAMEEYAQQPAVSDEKLSEIFANHADHTPYLNFDAFKAAIKELLNQKI